MLVDDLGMFLQEEQLSSLRQEMKRKIRPYNPQGHSSKMGFEENTVHHRLMNHLSYFRGHIHGLTGSGAGSVRPNLSIA